MKNRFRLKAMTIAITSILLVACSSTSKVTESNIGQQDAQYAYGTLDPFNPNSRLAQEQSVYFEYDRYDVSPSYFEMLKLHANYLTSHPQQTLRLEGNTDARGSSEYNLALGQRRSVAVSRILQQYGVNSRQLEAISYGKERPASLGHSETDYAQNRRTDLNYLQQ